MAITPRSVAENPHTGTSSTTLVVNLPATVVEGDLLTITTSTQESSDPGAPTTPAGWTQRFSTTPSAGFKPRITCLEKYATGTEGGTTVTVTWGTSTRKHAVAVAWAGVDPETPFDASASSVVQTGTIDPAAVTTVTDEAVVVLWVAGDGSPTPVPTLPAGYAMVADQAGDTRAILVATKTVETAGAENPGALTWSVSNFAVVTDSLRPDPDAEPEPEPEPVDPDPHRILGMTTTFNLPNYAS